MGGAYIPLMTGAITNTCRGCKLTFGFTVHHGTNKIMFQLNNSLFISLIWCPIESSDLQKLYSCGSTAYPHCQLFIQVALLFWILYRTTVCARAGITDPCQPDRPIHLTDPIPTSYLIPTPQNTVRVRT